MNTRATVTGPSCLGLEDTPPEVLATAGAGGKAVGLARLSRLGLRVPPGFVIIGASSNALPELGPALARLGSGPVAVRSSASDEDGADASFAGQYETVLEVEGEVAVRAAIVRCLDSLHVDRVAAYRAEREVTGELRMSVIVQRMVNPRVAGVLFTADPVTGRRDRTIIDATVGLGDRLVSGEVTPDHLAVGLDGEILVDEPATDVRALSDEEAARLVRQAGKAAAAYGHPLDLEWAIDGTGTLQWLQARPITGLAADPRELDTRPERPDALYTRCNIGEMMPGAVTPLTISVTAHGIDYGIQCMQVRCGIYPQVTDTRRFAVNFFNHLFIDLSAFAEMTRQVAGSNTERLGRAICGRPLPELEVAPNAPWWVRLYKGLRYGLYLFSAGRHRRAFQREVERLGPPDAANPVTLYRWIDGHLQWLWRAYDHHLVSSSVSGALTPALLEILAGGNSPTAEHEAHLAELLRGAENVESVDIATGLQRVVAAIAASPEAAAKVSALTASEADAWLRSMASGDAGEAWRVYLRRHGHRALRELELRQTEWRVDATSLIRTVQATLAAPPQWAARDLAAVPSDTLPEGRVLRWLVRRARRATSARERTKSLLVETTTRFKEAYRALGQQLADQGMLDDADLVFFLSHEELGRVVSGALGLDALAQSRRQTLDYQATLTFPEVFQGPGEPLVVPASSPGEGAGCLKGKPVSRGRVEGLARVVTSLDDAELIQPGEILIAPVVDVGWTPFFAMIGGLATEVGSAVSHGCVVAREYGLPAVVNLPGATQCFRTGEPVVLDAERGLLYRAGEAPEPEPS